jgi:hypothetical protein
MNLSTDPNVVLIFGEHARTRSSEGVTVLDCGCAHDEIRWLQICKPCYAPWKELHDAANAIERLL